MCIYLHDHKHGWMLRTPPGHLQHSTSRRQLCGATQCALNILFFIGGIHATTSSCPTSTLCLPAASRLFRFSRPLTQTYLKNDHTLLLWPAGGNFEIGLIIHRPRPPARWPGHSTDQPVRDIFMLLPSLCWSCGAFGAPTQYAMVSADYAFAPKIRWKDHVPRISRKQLSCA